MTQPDNSDSDERESTCTLYAQGPQSWWKLEVELIDGRAVLTLDTRCARAHAARPRSEPAAETSRGATAAQTLKHPHRERYADWVR